MNPNVLLLAIGTTVVAFSGVLTWTPDRPAHLSSAAGEEIKAESQRRVDLLDALGKDLTLWTSLSPEDKYDAVQMVLEAMSTQAHVRFKKSPSFYAQKIDERMASDGGMQTQPLDRVLMVISVMEYDFANGEDPDALARRVLGPGLYEANKKAHGGAPS